MNKYCVIVEKVTTKTEKIIVYANSVNQALNKADKACDSNKISFDKRIEESEYYNCNIDPECCMSDCTFDEEQYSDKGMQAIH